MEPLEKIVIITKKTALQELLERYSTRDQARFYIEHMGASFEEYEAAHDTYLASLALLKRSLPAGVRSQIVERGFLPTFQFGERDLVVTLGPDGLVVNTAKYVSVQPLLAFNPDPQRMDGVLIPFHCSQAQALLPGVMHGAYGYTPVTMVKAELNDGQSLYAVNDLFIGQRSHISARYRIAMGGKREDQSSSGIIVSTGAGSTGWLRSVLTGATGVVEHFHQVPQVHAVRESYRFDWTADYLYYMVREPFVSRVSAAEMIFGKIDRRNPLRVESQMTGTGVIFGEGVEEDYISFNSGSIARVGIADRRLHLVTSPA